MGIMPQQESHPIGGPYQTIPEECPPWAVAYSVPIFVRTLELLCIRQQRGAVLEVAFYPLTHFFRVIQL